VLLPTLPAELELLLTEAHAEELLVHRRHLLTMRQRPEIRGLIEKMVTAFAQGNLAERQEQYEAATVAFRRASVAAMRLHDELKAALEEHASRLAHQRAR
jgi:hypothetical protein